MTLGSLVNIRFDDRRSSLIFTTIRLGTTRLSNERRMGPRRRACTTSEWVCLSRLSDVFNISCVGYGLCVIGVYEKESAHRELRKEIGF